MSRAHRTCCSRACNPRRNRVWSSAISVRTLDSSIMCRQDRRTGRHPTRRVRWSPGVVPACDSKVAAARPSNLIVPGSMGNPDTRMRAVRERRDRSGPPRRACGVTRAARTHSDYMRSVRHATRSHHGILELARSAHPRRARVRRAGARVPQRSTGRAVRVGASRASFQRDHARPRASCGPRLVHRAPWASCDARTALRLTGCARGLYHEGRPRIRRAAASFERTRPSPASEDR